MSDLILNGILNLAGMLSLKTESGGKVKVGSLEVLIEVAKGSGPGHSSAGIPVILPPPPAAPTDPGTTVWIVNSFNKTVTANDKAIVTQGIHFQGNPGMATWPGIVQPSVGNPTVTINNIPINVQFDMGITLPNGGTVTYTSSGQ